MSTIIGEGTYGCALKPSLKCKKNNDVKYKNKISKFMLKRNAKTELKEYGKIDKADKNQTFYLGTPLMCDPEGSPEDREAVGKCRHFDKDLNFKEHKLLIMEDGGLNLKDYTNNVIKKMVKNDNNVEKIEKLLIEMQRMLWGLVVFLENDVIHHDLKPENIVYNEGKNRMNFIDFGLMTSLKKAKRDCKSGSYKWSIEHWSFPMELKYIDVVEYSKRATKTETEKKEEFNEYITKMKSNSSNPTNVALSYLLGGVEPSDHSLNVFMTSYYFFYLNDLKLSNYSKILLNSLETVDSYGTGLAFCYVIRNCKRFLDSNFYKELKLFFTEMSSPNAMTRRSAIETLREYEEMLETSGLLEKHGKRFENHELVDRSKMPKQIEKAIDSLDIILNDKELSKASLEPVRECKEGKEMNTLTMRCVQNCKPGFSRNDEFKCKKAKLPKEKAVSKKGPKECGEGKERNPKTMRCIKECKPGYSRNAEFQCKKTRKNLTK